MSQSDSHQVSVAAIASRTLISTLFHPVEYTKTLIQIGHEPIPPRPTRTLFGRPALALPNVIQYLRYIRKEDGFFGTYRGLFLKLCSNFANAFAYHRVTDNILETLDDNEDTKDEEPGFEEKFAQAMRGVVKDMLGRTAAVIASHPFQVMAVRSMAQFVGRETIYSSLRSSVFEIFHEEGVCGFYSGVVPRLIGEITTVALSHSLVFVVNNYFLQDATLKSYSSALIALVCSSITYPSLVVSNCMAVSGTRLSAGNPPHMPVYSSWLDCWSQLKAQGQLKRGSSVIWRYAPSTAYSTLITPLDNTGPPINFKYH